MHIDRRGLLKSSSVLIAGAGLPGWTSALRATPNGLPAYFEDIERRTFRWFWDTANPKNGLVPDRWPTPTFCSIAARWRALRD